MTADFVYTRLQGTKEEVETGYTPRELGRRAKLAHAWASSEPTDLPQFGKTPAKAQERDAFVYMIAGAKVRAPAAAMALLARLKKLGAIQ